MSQRETIHNQIEKRKTQAWFILDWQCLVEVKLV